MASVFNPGAGSFRNVPGAERHSLSSLTIKDESRKCLSSPTARSESDCENTKKRLAIRFPSFNIPPLLQFTRDQEKKRAAQFKKALGSKNPPEASRRDEELSHLLSVSTSGWVRPDKSERGRDAMEQLNNCLSSVTQDLTTMLGECTGESQSFVELLRRAQRTNGAVLHEQLKEIAMHEMKFKPSEAAEWMDVLFFHSGETPKKDCNRLGTR